MKRDVQGFLKELNELTNKYNISIWGCGCDGSPALVDLLARDGNIFIAESLTYDEETKKYTIDYIF